METLLSGLLGNPSSLHAEGRRARGAIDLARDEVATHLRVKPSQIVFTSGGTESNNLAVQGLALAHVAKGRHVITSATEHHAVLHAFRALEQRHGFSVTILPVDAEGRVNPDDLAAAIRPDTTLAAIMSANNETGVLQPIAELAKICRLRGVLFHTDAVQSLGKEAIPAGLWGVNSLSFTAHKLHGPVGAGVLWLEPGIPIARLQEGGAHENERRPGTENTAAIAGLAAALRFHGAPDARENERQRAWIEALWSELKTMCDIRWNGEGALRLPNTLNVTISGLHAEDFLIGLDLEGMAVSSGSACLVGSVQASHVLEAMNAASPQREFDPKRSATVRISIGPEIEDDDLPEIAKRIMRVVKQQRRLK
jgi:cysteine desulfurase